MPQPINLQKIKKHRIKKLIIIVVMILGATLLLFIGFFVLSFNGGFQGIKNTITPMPDPYSSELVQKREDSEKSINGTFESLEEIRGIKYFAAGSHDICLKGQANWKHTDDFSNKCTQKLTHFYGYNGDTAESVQEIDGLLKRAGWKAAGYNSADNLSYSKNDWKSSLTINFDEKENGAIKGFANQWAVSGFSEGHNLRNLQDQDKVYAEIATEYPYAITVSIQDAYFQN
jgi:hypothetical protein